MSGLPRIKKSVNNGEIAGFCDPRFGRVAEEFERNFWERGEVGASVCVNLGGETVVDLWGGSADPASNKPWWKIRLPMCGQELRELRPYAPICLFRGACLTSRLRWPATGQNLAGLAKRRYR